jgi:malate synthase
MEKHQLNGTHILAPSNLSHQKVLTTEALQFLAALHRQFNSRRLELLNLRIKRQEQLNAGFMPHFLPTTKHIRDDSSWQITNIPLTLQERKVEITGPVERKMMINALNSGASVFLADFEDALSPTWNNVLEGQINLMEAVNRSLSFKSPEGKQYALNEKTATLMVRPRGWHLPEKHILIDDQPISGSLFDFGLYFFHNVQATIEKGFGPYFYLPKLENHLEARLWNDVFLWAQQQLKIPAGTIKATVLIETILAAFEMEEISYELREHIVGLNAGRWDYIFSIIKKFQENSNLLFPDRSQITMTVPFMRSYTELLVQTCRKRGIHAMGGMAAFIPSRKDQEVNEKALAKVREDKEREANDGFDGTWVAHPDLVGPAMDIFNHYLGSKPHQKDKVRQAITVTEMDLLEFKIPDGTITEAGLQLNIHAALQYIENWLRGIGAVAIFNLMEDTATAEISRAQLWQWVHHPHAVLDNGQKITSELFLKMTAEEFQKIKAMQTKDTSSDKLIAAKTLLENLVTSKHFEDFLTLPAYELLE